MGEGHSKKSVTASSTRTNDAPLGIAALWDRWRGAAGQWQKSYTMLTTYADDAPPLFKHLHQPNKEKRIVVILPEGAYGDWLTASDKQSRHFLAPFPSDRLVAKPQSKQS
ncbi:MAG: SOS response-associated peptidase family protein [Achromobacter sp.]|uniref:SOS response-associated peptidase family protein n=1 Tax=Achromobacter sp. TaxID=134375 RepID=UPI003D08154F